jgi:hypothetical protein
MLMDATQLEEALDTIEGAYAETEDVDAAIEQLAALHASLLEDAELLETFRLNALTTCNGHYLPHLMWVALADFDTEPESARLRIFDILFSLATSDFDERLRNAIKPLAVVYFSKEKQFEIDRVHARVVDGAHPLVKEWFDKAIAFVQKNGHSAQAYVHKFNLLKARFPDFDRFNMPIARLEEELA